MIQRHCGEHTFDLDMILSSPFPIAIDVGCRGFEVSTVLAEAGVRVESLDIEAEVLLPDLNPRITFHHLALMGTEDARRCGWLTGSCRAGNGSHVCNVPREHGNVVRAVDIFEFLKMIGLPRVDLLKLDCEGSEYGIFEDLVSLDYPIARQITVEYHEHTGRIPPAGPAWFDQIPDRLSKNYQIIKHDREPLHHMDCLYIAREW